MSLVRIPEWKIAKPAPSIPRPVTGQGLNKGGNWNYIQAVTGGLAGNTCSGADRPNTWHITGAESGTLNSQLSFAGFANLTGRSGNDNFKFSDRATVSGVIDG
jgi:hypothetical protein